MRSRSEGRMILDLTALLGEISNHVLLFLSSNSSWKDCYVGETCHYRVNATFKEATWSIMI